MIFGKIKLGLLSTSIQQENQPSPLPFIHSYHSPWRIQIINLFSLLPSISSYSFYYGWIIIKNCPSLFRCISMCIRIIITRHINIHLLHQAISRVHFTWLLSLHHLIYFRCRLPFSCMMHSNSIFIRVHYISYIHKGDLLYLHFIYDHWL